MIRNSSVTALALGMTALLLAASSTAQAVAAPDDAKSQPAPNGAAASPKLDPANAPNERETPEQGGAAKTPEQPATDAASDAAHSANAADDSFGNSDAAATEIIATEEGPKLELYGFADVSYFRALSSKDNILRQYLATYPTFFVGHFNLYLSSQLGENWRSLAEVRFVYSPTGNEDKPAPDGTFPATDTSAEDYAELDRYFSWGGIEIQRVWIEYQPFDFLNVRAGQWFTPYGFWNDDHGSPAIIAVHKPFPILDQLFPEKQTGIEAHGKYFIGSTAINYALTVSNGRGPYDAFRDLDNNKAVGGRLNVETNVLGTLEFGVSAYRGRYTASTKKYRVNTEGAEPVVEFYRTVDRAYEELSLSADLRWQWKNLHLQVEAIENEATFDEKARPRVQGFNPKPTFVADYRRFGGYALLGYRTPWLNLMPYGMAEYASYTDNDFLPPMAVWTGGVNLRPTANVVLKAELSTAHLYGVGSSGLKDGLTYIGTQAAWAY